MTKQKKPKRGFMDGYRTYSPEKEGFGSVSAWSAAWESMGFAEAVKVVAGDDPLSIMGFAALPTLDELKQAYRKLMKIHHPDAGGDPEEAKRIIAAYTILNDRLSK